MTLLFGPQCQACRWDRSFFKKCEALFCPYGVWPGLWPGRLCRRPCAVLTDACCAVLADVCSGRSRGAGSRPCPLVMDSRWWGHRGTWTRSIYRPGGLGQKVTPTHLVRAFLMSVLRAFWLAYPPHQPTRQLVNSAWSLSSVVKRRAKATCACRVVQCHSLHSFWCVLPMTCTTRGRPQAPWPAVQSLHADTLAIRQLWPVLAT